MQEAKARDLIAALDLSSVKARVAKQHPKVSKEKLDALEEEYRGFLFINWKFPNENHVPSLGVDEFWHAHILHTEDYTKDCKAVFGHYFHHKIFRHDLPES